MKALLKAYTLLAFAFFTTVLSRWLHLGKRYGLPAFHRNYASEHLSAMRPGDGAVLVGAGKCMACRRCEDGDLPLLQRYAGVYPGLMSLVLASARSTASAHSAQVGWQVLPSDELERRERLCPEGVPIVALGELVRHHAGLSEASAGVKA
jgi:hypothetical protein